MEYSIDFATNVNDDVKACLDLVFLLVPDFNTIEDDLLYNNYQFNQLFVDQITIFFCDETDQFNDIVLSFVVVDLLYIVPQDIVAMGFNVMVGEK